MFHRTSRTTLVALSLSAALYGACAVEDGEHDPGPELGVDDQDIIGGGAAPSIVPVGHVFPESNPNNFCTATLIGPDLVLTAKHCVYVDGDPAAGYLLDQEAIYFTLTDSNDPSRWTDAVPAIDVDAAPALPPPPDGDRYFLADLANDVAIYRLERAIPGVRPVAVGAELPSATNRSFIGVGFGRTSHAGDSATSRNAGPLTFRQNGGSQLKSKFGSFFNYVRAVWTLAPGTDVHRLRDEFDNEILAPDYEMWFDGPGNVQVCNGDSGGPLLQQTSDGGWRVFGVVSGSKSYGPESRCYFGSVYATFGPTTQAFLRSHGVTLR